ncbi:DUF2804 domain-containing protein [Planococcus sp. N028]|uniref:DUF2804 domain-containing protein n=1 Tax=Planococcus shixiaomingii TaxID=3058393 RepID=A0ABT8N1V8_9BACL|nr:MULTISPECIES: DUF2804 domain-containing protein [unclassified Planococcus (in: firmicutes)]MDN7241876.1 DUF2804 domain-containing protein [Planococcus sp. N028]WKA54161.1 DUF2804 domain-containing protein [Planococcus sp. N022]
MQHVERELTERVMLCDAKGQLNPNAIGFAREPLIECNLRGNFLRKKKWNYWCVFGEELMFSATISHLDYATVCNVYFLNYETLRFQEKTVMLPFTRQLKLPGQVLESSFFRHDDMAIKFDYSQNKTHITVTIEDFEGESLQADLEVLHPETHDSLNVVIPWNRQTFQFTGKHLSLPTSGSVKIGSQRFEFDADDSYAILDYGRGVWPRETSWNWAMASQRFHGKVIGLNFGGKWTDGTGMTENAFFINGKMTKIHEDVLFRYNRENFKEPWLIHTKFSDDVKLTFIPFFERISKTDVRLVKSEVHQLFGYYNGYVREPDGKKIKILQMLGAIEEHHAKW